MQLFGSGSEGVFNAGGYKNSSFDAIAQEFLAETDVNVAQTKAFELQALIAEELPAVALFNVPILEAFREDLVEWSFTEVLNGVQAYFPNPNGPLTYTRVE